MKGILKWKQLLFIGLIIILLGGGYVLAKGYGGTEKLSIDGQASEGPLPSGMSDEEIKKMLLEKVDEGMINITMSADIVLENGNGEAELKIENKKVNRFPQVIEIQLEETGEVIYKSGLVPVGYKIERARLKRDLAKGEYKCIAYFSSFDEESETIVGRAGANINITVKA